MSLSSKKESQYKHPINFQCLIMHLRSQDYDSGAHRICESVVAVMVIVEFSAGEKYAKVP